MTLDTVAAYETESSVVFFDEADPTCWLSAPQKIVCELRGMA